MRLSTLFLLLVVFAVAVAGCKDEEVPNPTLRDDRVTGAARLHLAAQKGDLALVRFLVAGGYSVDARDKDGFSPLYTATKYGQTSIVEFLISEGADVNVEMPECRNVLFVAARNGFADIVKLLVAAGADVNGGTLRGWTPLYEAGHLLADSGHEEVVRLLLANGAEVIPGDTRENEGLLYFAVEHRMHDLVETLLTGGANPNTVSRFGTGMSVLGETVARGDTESARLLIADGADINRKDATGVVPLHYARRWSKDVVELLLAKGADVNAEFLLHWFVEADEEEILELLLAYGADVNRKNLAGKTPLDVAIASGRGREAVVDLLKRHGGIRGDNGDSNEWHEDKR